MPVQNKQLNLNKRQISRPVNLNLMTMHFPVTAIVSILHRVSGILLVLMIPLGLWLLDLSLSSPSGFIYVQTFFQKISIKLMLWVFLSALYYHLLAGLRHFFMDAGWGESLKAGKISAYLIILMTVIYSALAGIFLW